MSAKSDPESVVAHFGTVLGHVWYSNKLFESKSKPITFTEY